MPPFFLTVLENSETTSRITDSLSDKAPNASNRTDCAFARFEKVGTNLRF